MKLLKKLAKDQSMRLILSELLTMALISGIVSLLLYLYFGHIDDTFIHMPIYLPVGFAIMFMVILKKEILSKINYPLFRNVFAALFGVLFFCFLWLFGTLKFLYLFTGAGLMFFISAFVGIRFKDKINKRVIYSLCCILIFGGFLGEFACLMLLENSSNLLMATTIGACGGLLNLADFSGIDQLRQMCIENKSEKNIEKLIAQTVFVNFCSCIIVADASRLVTKIFLYGDFNNIFNKK